MTNEETTRSEKLAAGLARLGLAEMRNQTDFNNVAETARQLRAIRKLFVEIGNDTSIEVCIYFLTQSRNLRHIH
jgi:hypothetical protein